MSPSIRLSSTMCHVAHRVNLPHIKHSAVRLAFICLRSGVSLLSSDPPKGRYNISRLSVCRHLLQHSSVVYCPSHIRSAAAQRHSLASGCLLPAVCFSIPFTRPHARWRSLSSYRLASAVLRLNLVRPLPVSLALLPSVSRLASSLSAPSTSVAVSTCAIGRSRPSRRRGGCRLPNGACHPMLAMHRLYRPLSVVYRIVSPPSNQWDHLHVSRLSVCRNLLHLPSIVCCPSHISSAPSSPGGILLLPSVSCPPSLVHSIRSTCCHSAAFSRFLPSSVHRLASKPCSAITRHPCAAAFRLPSGIKPLGAIHLRRCLHLRPQPIASQQKARRLSVAECRLSSGVGHASLISSIVSYLSYRPSSVQPMGGHLHVSRLSVCRHVLRQSSVVHVHPTAARPVARHPSRYRLPAISIFRQVASLAHYPARF